jgi:hypothetical protein
VTRDELLEIAAANIPAIRRFYRRRLDRAPECLLDDCAQQAMLSVIESWEAIRAEPAARSEAGAVVFQHMRRAVSRFLYAEARERGAISLNKPIGDDPESAEIGELVEDGRAPDPVDICDARRCVEAMSQLTGREARILIAIADDVPLDAIANEHGVPVLEVLSIRASAAQKVRDAAFARVMTRRTHRPLRSFDISQFGRPDVMRA